MSYPLHLDLAGRPVLVAGGGPVAARKARGCLAAGADVLVVAPEICEALETLVVAGELRWARRQVSTADVDGMWLVHAATGDGDVDRLLADTAHSARIWCVTAANVELGTARTPAVLRREHLTIGVSDDGTPDPVRAATLRSSIALALDSGELPLRRRRRSGPGSVTLVGGGPGVADLITVRGRRALAGADVILHDRLGPSPLLSGLEPDVELVDVGKTSGHHPVPQHEINELLIARATAGATVVRLKGGDPFVFGRGYEEVEACRAAGVAVRVIAGVSSAFAAPLAAGIPVTARGLAQGVLVLTGHQLADGDEAPALFDDAARWCARGNTLVVLMGVAALPALAAGLLAAGLDAQTPAAVVESGTTDSQRTTRAVLETLAPAAMAASVRPPAVIIVGAVAALA